MKDTKDTAVLLVGAVVWLTCLSGAQTSTTGAIAGVVKDPSGAVVSGARIALSNAAGVERDTTTDATGHYAFLLLPPGGYGVKANRSGFSETVEDVTVRITETTSADISLQIAAQQVVVEVRAAQEVTPTQGTVIQQEQIRQLPLPTRNFQQLDRK